MKAGKFPESSALVLQNLKKIYRNYKFGVIHDKKTDFTAVNGLNLHIEGNVTLKSTLSLFDEKIFFIFLSNALLIIKI